MKHIPFLLLALSLAIAFGADRRSLLIARNNASSTAGPPVPGFTLWLDAQDTATMFTNGIGTAATVGVPAGGTDLASARVGKWVDKSSGGTNHAYEVGDIVDDTRPYLTNGVFGGKSALRFAQNASGRSGLQSSNATTFGTVSGDSFTILIAGSKLSSGADSFSMAFTWGGGGTGFEVRQVNTAQNVQLITPNFSAASGTIVLGQGYVFTWIFNNTGNTLTCFTNLSQASTTSSVTDDVPGAVEYALGKRVDADVANYWFGFIGEVLVYPNALSGADLTNSITYLKNRYAF